MTVYCSVDTCWKSKASKHRFPNPDKEPARFNEWVKLTGNKRLTKEMIPSKIYNNCRICSLHFESTDFVTNGKLRKGAVPSKLLPDPLVDGFPSAQLTSETKVLKILSSASNDVKCNINSESSSQILGSKNSLIDGFPSAQSTIETNVHQILGIPEILSSTSNDVKCNINSKSSSRILGSKNSLRDGSPSVQFTSETKGHQIVSIPKILPSTSNDVKCNINSEISSRILASKNPSIDRFPSAQFTNEIKIDRILAIPEIRPSASNDVKCNSEISSPKSLLEEKALTKLPPNLFKKGTYLKLKVITSKKDCQSSTKSVEESQTLSNNETCEKTAPVMKHVRARFFRSRTENIYSSPTSKQFSLEDKALALVLYRQTSTCYQSLSKLFPLPSKETLLELLHGVPIRPGLHEELFDVLKTETKYLKYPLDRYCILLFNEMTIQPHLSSNLRDGSIQGFEEFGLKKTDAIADHVQVFMLRGINHNWSIPVCYYLRNGKTEKIDLINYIKMIISKCNSNGIHVVSTVCDHRANNRAAINSLVKETRETYKKEGMEFDSYYFEVDGTNVIPLFDVPHLFKGLRNNLVKYNLLYSEGDKNRIGKWGDIFTAYKMNLHLDGFYLMPKLSDVHVDPKKMNKVAGGKGTEVFSRSAAVAVNAFASLGIVVNTGQEVLKLEKFALDTANLLNFLDQLFDSFNEDYLNPPVKKPLRSAVKINNSQHIIFWEKAVERLKTFKFVKDEAHLTPPSLKRLITTVTNFMSLFNTLDVLGFTYLFPRTFNQDPLKNFFRNIRQRGRRNLNPTTEEFTKCYKKLLVKGFLSRSSVAINCENDNSEVAFSFLRLVSQTVPEIIYDTTSTFSRPPPNTRNSIEPIKERALRYVAQYLDREFAQHTCNCKNFYFQLTDGRSVAEKHNGLQLRFINHQFLQKIRKGLSIIKYVLNHNFHKRGVLTDILKMVCSNISFAGCFHDEKIKKSIFRYFIKIKAFHYCAEINSSLKGLHSKSIPVKLFKLSRKMYLNFLKRKRAFCTKRA